MTENQIDGPIGDAYAAYDSDPRAGGPDNFEAYADSIKNLIGSEYYRGFEAGYEVGKEYGMEVSLKIIQKASDDLFSWGINQ